MFKEKFRFIIRRKYYYLIFGLLLIRNGLGLVLVIKNDSIRDLVISTFNEMDMGKPNIEKCFSQDRSQVFD
jgi:hypothetical protein